MTSEIILMNRGGLAVAADSAVTVDTKDGRKSFNTVNKIFTLSKFHPVGAVIYGSSSFLGVPWETIVKVYRKEVGAESRDQLTDYSNHFLSWLGNQSFLGAEAQENYVLRYVHGYFELLKEEFQEELFEHVTGQIEQGKQGRRIPFEEKLKEFLTARRDKLSQVPDVFDDNGSYIEVLQEKHGGLIRRIGTETFGASTSPELLEQLGLLALAKRIQSPMSTGLVIFGFGEEDVFPQTHGFFVDGMAAGKIKFYEDEHSSFGISLDDPGIIIPLAQTREPEGFITGIQDDYRTVIVQAIHELLANLKRIATEELKKDSIKESIIGHVEAVIERAQAESLENLGEKLQQFEVEKFLEPTRQTVTVLPKEELAEMAESLVTLSSMRQRFSMDLETVGGPVDVAIVTKGDGFVWTKRKHYFPPELNPVFPITYMKR